MKMKTVGFALLLGGLVLSSQIVFGQGPGPGRGMGPGGRGMHMGGGKVVTGAPYSATVTNTTTKTLADGNVIQHTTTGTVARDSQGRTYSQETVTGMFGQSGTKVITFISDPVAGYVYTLNAVTKTAMRRPLPATGEHAGEHAGRAAGRAAGMPHTSPDAVTADLGSQVVNGVTATGKTVTHTIPVGQMGNEKPIVATTETWYSPDLHVVISSKRTDPREGTSAYALTNITRTEPSSALFAVPSDYTVKDAPSFGGRH